MPTVQCSRLTDLCLDYPGEPVPERWIWILLNKRQPTNVAANIIILTPLFHVNQEQLVLCNFFLNLLRNRSIKDTIKR